MDEQPTTRWTRERWARFEHARQTRRSMMRWRWVMVALGSLLAIVLLLRGSVVIGGLLAALMERPRRGAHPLEPVVAPAGRPPAGPLGRLTVGLPSTARSWRGDDRRPHRRGALGLRRDLHAVPVRRGARVRRGAGHRSGHIHRAALRPLRHDTDHAWHRLERGEMSIVDALARDRGRGQAVRPGVRPHEDPLVARRRPRPHHRRRHGAQVRAHGVRTAIVTNNIREYGDAWRRMVPVDELFDVVVDSCRGGHPQARPAHLHARARATRRGRRATARCSSTTSTATSARRARSACTASS